MKRFSFLIIILLTLFPAIVFAVSLNIDNPSFEKPVDFPRSGSEGYWVYNVPSWREYGKVGVFEPTTGSTETNSDSVFAQIQDGSQTAYLNDGFIYQILENTFSPYRKYTLSVAVGNRYDLQLRNFKISLISGDDYGDDYDEVVSFQGNDSDVSNGGFKNFYVSYTALPGDPHLDKNIGIKLENLEGAAQVNFDQVSLSNHIVPEPTTWLLLGTGILGFVGFTRKKFFKKT